jgi:hypothetical protein
MPNLNVKALAKLLLKTEQQRERILYKYKYPKFSPQIFAAPYYHRAIAGIRDFYREDSDPKALAAAAGKIQSISQLVKRENNLRVLRRFSESREIGRKLRVEPNRRVVAAVGNLVVKLSADIRALEDRQGRVLYYNCKAQRLGSEEGSLTVELSKWVCEQNDLTARPEMIDLFGDTVFEVGRVPSDTVHRLRELAKFIDRVWPDL